MARIEWVEDEDATGQLAETQVLRENSSMGSRVPDIMHDEPEARLPRSDLKASNLHFSDGALTRAQHEMIASYVSALNRCHY